MDLIAGDETATVGKEEKERDRRRMEPGCSGDIGSGGRIVKVMGC